MFVLLLNSLLFVYFLIYFSKFCYFSHHFLKNDEKFQNLFLKSFFFFFFSAFKSFDFSDTVGF